MTKDGVCDYFHSRVLAAFGVILLASACAGGEHAVPTQASSQGFSAEIVAGGVRIQNNTQSGVAYTIWDEGFLALLGPCVDPGPECVRLPAGATELVPESEIAAFGTTGRLVVYWWHVVPDGRGGYGHTPVGTILLGVGES